MQRETLQPRTGQQRGSQPSHGAPKVDRPAPKEGGKTWGEVLKHWALVEADFQEHYSLDLEREIDHRSGRWLRVRILGLLSIESRIRLTLFPPDERGYNMGLNGGA